MNNINKKAEDKIWDDLNNIYLNIDNNVHFGTWHTIKYNIQAKIQDNIVYRDSFEHNIGYSIVPELWVGDRLRFFDYLSFSPKTLLKIQSQIKEQVYEQHSA